MTTINTNQIPDSGISGFGSKTAKPEAVEAQDRFLKLLVTQMQNQDPLNPMDNAQVTSQMAQLSTVTGIDKLNSSVNSLVSSFQANQSFQAASVIGHGVLAEGSSITLKDGAAPFGIELAQSASDVTVDIKNAAGTVVASIKLGNQEEGIHPFSWDGKDSNGNAVAEGKYSFEVNAKKGGEDVSATELTFGVVNSVTTGPQGVRVNTETDSNIDYTSIRQIL